MKASNFFTKFNNDNIEYIRVLNKQIYQVIEVSCWNQEIPQNEFYFSVGIKIMPICAPNLYKGMLKEAIDINNIIENRIVNYNVLNMRCEQDNVDVIINQIKEKIIPELNSIETYKKLYKKITNGCGYLEDVYTSETKLWLYFICDEYYEQYDTCINLAKTYRISEEKQTLEHKIPDLKCIEELFGNYKIDELNRIVKQTEEKNLKELELIGVYVI